MLLQWMDMSDEQRRESVSAYLAFFEKEIMLRLPEYQRERGMVPDGEATYSPNMCFLSDTKECLQTSADSQASYPCRRARAHMGPCDCSYGLGIADPSFEPTVLDENVSAIAHSVSECFKEVRLAQQRGEEPTSTSMPIADYPHITVRSGARLETLARCCS